MQAAALDPGQIAQAQAFLAGLTPDQRAALQRKFLWKAARQKLQDYVAYPKQREFHAAGATHREKLFLAGNRVGKTRCGGAEVAMHLTGEYPDWWTGRRFDGPIMAWVAGVTNESTRDVVQAELMGPPKERGEWGTGMVPAANIVGEPSMARGAPDLMDTVTIRHKAGGNSTLQFKTYEKGREKWQGTKVHVVWLDEECPIDVYMEALTRTNEVDGLVLTTFTPLKGMSDLVLLYLRGTDAGKKLFGDQTMEVSDEAAAKLTGRRHVTVATIDDALHFTAAQRQAIIDQYPDHEREARTKGIPALGSGRIFPIPESEITCEPFDPPYYWRWIGCLDFGWDHPFGAAKLVYDPDNDRIYVTQVYRIEQKTPHEHCTVIRNWGEWLPWAWPHDGLHTEKGTGVDLGRQYRDAGLNMLPEMARYPSSKGNSVEAGLMDMLDRMRTGRWKVFRTCFEWLEEFRLYHREDGKVVKIRDDVISATRAGLMMLRYATTAPKGGARKAQGSVTWDYDIFANV